MRFSRPLAAGIALSMSATPVFAQSAAPLSIAPAGAQLEQASGFEGDGNYLLPAVVIFAVLAAAILYTSNHESDIDNPTSP